MRLWIWNYPLEPDEFLSEYKTEDSHCLSARNHWEPVSSAGGGTWILSFLLHIARDAVKSWLNGRAIPRGQHFPAFLLLFWLFHSFYHLYPGDPWASIFQFWVLVLNINQVKAESRDFKNMLQSYAKGRMWIDTSISVCTRVTQFMMWEDIQERCWMKVQDTNTVIPVTGKLKCEANLGYLLR